MKNMNTKRNTTAVFIFISTEQDDLSFYGYCSGESATPGIWNSCGEIGHHIVKTDINQTSKVRVRSWPTKHYKSNYLHNSVPLVITFLFKWYLGFCLLILDEIIIIVTQLSKLAHYANFYCFNYLYETKIFIPSYLMYFSSQLVYVTNWDES